MPDSCFKNKSERAAAFEAAGGRVLRIESAAEFVFPHDFPRDVEGNRALKVCHRRTEAYDFYYLVDWDGKTPIRLRSEGVLEFWDPWTGERRSEPPASGPVLAVVKREQGKSRATILPTMRRTVDRIPVDGEWTVEYLPVLDNSDGDYRLPATPGPIGPEVTRMFWVEEHREQMLGFAPQFLEDGCADPFEFSWRYGVFGKPGDQDNYHGLNRRVTGDFFILGPYDVSYFYDMDPKDGETPPHKVFRTGVYAPAPTKAKVTVSATAPFTADNSSKPRWPKPGHITMPSCPASLFSCSCHSENTACRRRFPLRIAMRQCPDGCFSIPIGANTGPAPSPQLFRRVRMTRRWRFTGRFSKRRSSMVS